MRANLRSYSSRRTPSAPCSWATKVILPNGTPSMLKCTVPMSSDVAISAGIATAKEALAGRPRQQIMSLGSAISTPGIDSLRVMTASCHTGRPALRPITWSRFTCAACAFTFSKSPAPYAQTSMICRCPGTRVCGPNTAKSTVSMRFGRGGVASGGDGRSGNKSTCTLSFESGSLSGL